jgi:hypothetical protein
MALSVLRLTMRQRKAGAGGDETAVWEVVCEVEYQAGLYK